MSTTIHFTPISPAPTDSPRRPDVVAALSGAWRGRLTDTGGHTESFNLQPNGATGHRVRGQFLQFTTPAGLAAPVRLLEAGERVFVALIGPYFDPAAGTFVVTVLEGAQDEGVIEGTFHTRPHSGRETLRSGRFTAARADPAHRAA